MTVSDTIDYTAEELTALFEASEVTTNHLLIGRRLTTPARTECLACQCSADEVCGACGCPHCGPWASGRDVGWLEACTWTFRHDAEIADSKCSRAVECELAGRCLNGRDIYYGHVGDSSCAFDTRSEMEHLDQFEYLLLRSAEGDKLLEDLKTHRASLALMRLFMLRGRNSGSLNSDMPVHARRGCALFGFCDAAGRRQSVEVATHIGWTIRKEPESQQQRRTPR